MCGPIYFVSYILQLLLLFLGLYEHNLSVALLPNSVHSTILMRGDLVTRCIREHPLDATRSALRSGSRQLDMLP
jgi:hypothetical protein